MATLLFGQKEEMHKTFNLLGSPTTLKKNTTSIIVKFETVLQEIIRKILFCVSVIIVLKENTEGLINFIA